MLSHLRYHMCRFFPPHKRGKPINTKATAYASIPTHAKRERATAPKLADTVVGATTSARRRTSRRTRTGMGSIASWRRAAGEKGDARGSASAISASSTLTCSPCARTTANQNDRIGNIRERPPIRMTALGISVNDRQS
eukprot:1190572-Prorocentrum_minimum.AAC.1